MGFPQPGPGGGGGAPTTDTYITGANETATLPNSLQLGTSVILPPGLLAARPAANTVPAGAIYDATDNGTIYRSDGTATWTALTISQVGALIAANNLSDLTNVPSARTNLGLGAAALIGTPISIANGGTGQAAQQAAFDALSPLTTEGDIIAFLSGHNARVAAGAANTVLGMSAGDPAWIKRAYPLYSGGNYTQINSIATTKSGIGGAIAAAIPANTLQVGDVLHMSATGQLINASGSSSTNYMDFFLNGLQAGFHVTVSQVTATTRWWSMHLTLVVTAIGASGALFISDYLYLMSAGNANQIVLASSVMASQSGAGWTPSATIDTTSNISFDVICGATINNVSMTCNVWATELLKIPV